MRKGVLLAAASYVAWGLFPAYFLLLKSVSPVEVLAHRMIWSLVFLAFVLAYRRQWSWLRPLTGQPRLVVGFAVSAALLSGNWLLYIWAVTTGHVIDASLGYFINPLVNIVLGFLQEPFTLNEHVSVVCIPSITWVPLLKQCYITGKLSDTLNHAYQTQVQGVCDYVDDRDYNFCTKQVGGTGFPFFRVRCLSSCNRRRPPTSA